MYRLGDCICFAGTVSKTTRRPCVISLDEWLFDHSFHAMQNPDGVRPTAGAFAVALRSGAFSRVSSRCRLSASTKSGGTLLNKND
jgi:hypothetical protein